jgi:hypothetical protein
MTRTRPPTRDRGAARGLAILSAAVIMAAFGLAGCQVISDVSIEYQSAGASYGADPTCPASNTEADAAGLVGVAHCTDLAWASDPAQTPAPRSAFTSGFDATITFEARP